MVVAFFVRGWCDKPVDIDIEPTRLEDLVARELFADFSPTDFFAWDFHRQDADWISSVKLADLTDFVVLWKEWPIWHPFVYFGTPNHIPCLSALFATCRISFTRAASRASFTTTASFLSTTRSWMSDSRRS